MARTITDIKASIVAQKNAEPNLSGLTSASQTAVWNLWAYIVAVAIHFHETLWDLFKVELETIAANAVPGTTAWLHSKVLQFQYDALDPQVLQLINFVPTYVPVDATKRIITRASVRQNSNKVVDVKVAKGTYPSLSALSNDEKSALASYLDDIRFAGTEINIISQNADRAKITAEIYYDGQYVSSAVKTAVIGAIDNYFANLAFDGVMKISAIVDAIQDVPGVNDVVITEVKARESTVAVGSATVVSRIWETQAGYIISEDTAGHTLNDTLTMILG